ncbi:hypothetical protein E3N88_24075 [Mikania micrantha]|uniref:Uncharacterized protein n=1 Tax=Mikania micrantha TaxID=192012 RepID=A0A5N6NF74_9ASTR|nr:hypothetical protein E3N88_24075 [Mikania micrantha]
MMQLFRARVFNSLKLVMRVRPFYTLEDKILAMGDVDMRFTHLLAAKLQDGKNLTIHSEFFFSGLKSFFEKSKKMHPNAELNVIRRKNETNDLEEQAKEAKLLTLEMPKKDENFMLEEEIVDDDNTKTKKTEG